MIKLAIDGGGKTFQEPPVLNPVLRTYPETAALLNEIYFSKNWSFYGRYENEFAEKFAACQTAKHGVFMANGTVTLECALQALNVGRGDEVIVPAYTWVATGMAPLYVGATPVIVDVEPDTLCMDPAAFEAAITPRTKAVIPVHLFGSMADMEKIMAIARKHGLKVIEDCAHAHGGFWNGQGAGSIGDIGSFSFQQSKLMAAGEGGFCTTNDPELFDRLGRLKHIGYQQGSKQGKSANPPPEGLLCHNYRSTEFQAAILLGQLEHLKEDTSLREKNALYFQSLLEKIPGISHQKRGRLATVQSYYIFVFMIQNGALKAGRTRDDIAKALAAEGAPGVGPIWGRTIFEHPLWNVPKDQYRLENSRVAQNFIDNQELALNASWLMSNTENLELLAEALTKVMMVYGA